MSGHHEDDWNMMSISANWVSKPKVSWLFGRFNNSKWIAWTAWAKVMPSSTLNPKFKIPGILATCAPES